jgi:hypothetical protein
VNPGGAYTRDLSTGCLAFVAYLCFAVYGHKAGKLPTNWRVVTRDDSPKSFYFNLALLWILVVWSLAFVLNSILKMNRIHPLW